MAHCLITGCRLFVNHHQSVWGDLHGCCDDTIFVFNANINRLTRNPCWEYRTKWHEGEKAFIVHGDYFEKHGIFTFAALEDWVKFSNAAVQYLKGVLPWIKT